MDKRHRLLKLAAAMLLLATMAGAASCTSAVEAGPRAWIDFPRDGASGPPGAAVSVICHASAPKGVAEVLLSVNGAPYRRSPLDEAGAAFGKVTFEWLPGAPGTYTLQARAYDTAGTASGPDTITVRIGETAPLTGEATPTATALITAAPEPATATPTLTPVPAAATPTPTAVPPTATPTPFPPVQVKFVTDRGSVGAGECALLQWAVQHATAVYLDGEGVAGVATKSVCPTTTTTYTLHVEAPAGNVDERITITVTDTTPPPVPAPQVPADGLLLDPCPDTQTLAWLPVSDPSGVAGYDVRLERQTTPGHWVEVQAWDMVAGKQVSADVDCGLYYRWRVRARDGAGNVSAWSAWSQFSVTLS